MKRIFSLLTALAFVGFAGVASANETTLGPGDSSECLNAGWIAYNSSESKDTSLEFDIGPHAYNWGKVYKVNLVPGGWESNAVAAKTTFKNNGPGNVVVNCQRQTNDRHDWKIDAGSGKTYRLSQEMIERLTLQMNRARQASITTELMEIVGGAEALNN